MRISYQLSFRGPFEGSYNGDQSDSNSLSFLCVALLRCVTVGQSGTLAPMLFPTQTMIVTMKTENAEREPLPPIWQVHLRAG